MKVLLIYPLPRLARKPGPKWLPLGLSFIASSLEREGHQVKIFDRLTAAASVGPKREIINHMMMKELRNFKPDLVGFSTVSPLIYDTVSSAEIIRAEHNCTIVAGGHHATALPQLTLQKIPALDGVIQGEGELVLPRLASGEDPLSIPGVWWKDDSSIQGSPPSQIADLDSLPFPNLSLLDLDYYGRPGRGTIRGHHLSSLSLVTSRGCLYNCDFCAERLTYGKGLRQHSPDYVLEWINSILANYKTEAFYIHDNDFLSNRERAEMICEKIIDSGLNRKIKFAIQTSVNRIDHEIAALLKKAGCVLVEMGLEAAEQRLLDSVNKKATVQMNERAVKVCHKAGLPVHAYMMQGFAGETLNDLENRMRWLKRAGKSVTVTMPMLQLYPGTKIYREKGGRFFEKEPWTEGVISEYYRTDHLTAISPEGRLTWHQKKFTPLMRRRNRLALLANTPLPRFISLVLQKLKRKMLSS